MVLNRPERSFERSSVCEALLGDKTDTGEQSASWTSLLIVTPQINIQFNNHSQSSGEKKDNRKHLDIFFHSTD